MREIITDKWKTDLNTIDFSNIFVTKIGHMFGEPNQFYTNFFVRHDYCIQFVVRGKGEYFVNNHLYHLKENCLFLLPKDRYHYYAANPENPYDYFWIHFNGSGFKNFLSAIGLSEDNPVIFDVKNPEIEKRFLELIDLTSKNTPYQNLKLLSHAYYLLYEIAKAIPSNKEDRQQFTSLIVEAAANYITEHYQEKITLDDLAEVTHINKCYLVSLFKKCTGLTPIQYLIQYRISQACILLQSDVSITEICFMCGFQELTNFLVRFKQFTKLTPSQYRKNLQLSLETENPNTVNTKTSKKRKNSKE